MLAASAQRRRSAPEKTQGRRGAEAQKGGEGDLFSSFCVSASLRLRVPILALPLGSRERPAGIALLLVAERVGAGGIRVRVGGAGRREVAEASRAVAAGDLVAAPTLCAAASWDGVAVARAPAAVARDGVAAARGWAAVAGTFAGAAGERLEAVRGGADVAGDRVHAVGVHAGVVGVLVVAMG